MSNFETEYKKYAQDSTPDLWDRIEAGVDAYEASASQDVTKEDSPIIMPEVSKEAKSDSQQEIERKTGKAIPFKEAAEKSVRKSFSKKGIRKYAGIIAAAACLLIATPAIIYFVNNPVGLSSATPAAEAPMAAAEPMEAASEMAFDVAEDSAAPAAEYAEEVAEAEESVAMDSEAEYTGEAAEAEESLVADSAAEYAEEAAEAENGVAMEASADEAMVESEEVLDENWETMETPAMATAAQAEKRDAKEMMAEGEETMDTNACAIRAMWNEEAGSEKGELITLDKNMPSTRVHLFIDEKIDDFKIMRISIYDFSEEGKVLYNSEDVYKGGTMKAGDELVLKLSFPGDTPPYAISYTDSKGNEKVYGIEQSGRDGSVILTEL